MKAILGWTAVVICTLISSGCGFWGAIEGFHEGWFHKSLGSNLLWLGAYLIPAVAIAGFGIVSVLYPRVGMALCALIGILIAVWVLTGHFRVNSGNWPIPFCFTIAPIMFGLMFLYGNPCPKPAAIWVMAAIPVLVIIACGSPVAWRVMHRTDDGNRGARVIEANGVAIEWAGEGPGWDRKGCVTWHEARRRCEFLSKDGKTLADAPQNIWRLPTVSELVQSMSLHNRNCGGKWNPKARKAIFAVGPDKESPLWDTSSEVTYYWTDTETDSDHAYWAVYDGGVFLKRKDQGPGNVGFRAVREVRK